MAQGLCDTALGTDTGGSVRVPASFCGLYGIRPTHGRLDLGGMMRQAPSSDTTGWFARDADTFARVSEVLLGEPAAAELPTRLVVAADAFGLADDETAAALRPMVCRLSALVRDVREELLAPPGLSVWARAQRTLQSYEAWVTFKDWIDRENPRMAWSVARNLALAATISEPEREWATLTRAEARGRLAWLLRPGTILCLPTTPFPAPRKGLPLPDPLPAARPHHLPGRARRPDRRAAGEHSRRARGRAAGRPVHPGRARHRRHAGGGREGPGAALDDRRDVRRPT